MWYLRTFCNEIAAKYKVLRYLSITYKGNRRTVLSKLVILTQRTRDNAKFADISIVRQLLNVPLAISRYDPRTMEKRCRMAWRSFRVLSGLLAIAPSKESLKPVVKYARREDIKIFMHVFTSMELLGTGKSLRRVAENLSRYESHKNLTFAATRMPATTMVRLAICEKSSMISIRLLVLSICISNASGRCQNWISSSMPPFLSLSLLFSHVCYRSFIETSSIFPLNLQITRKILQVHVVTYTLYTCRAILFSMEEIC